MRRLVVVVPLVSVVLTGCAVGNRYAYQSVVASPQVSGTTAVSVATHDQREYVVDVRLVGCGVREVAGRHVRRHQEADDQVGDDREGDPDGAGSDQMRAIVHRVRRP